ncbi:hypothetical protein HYT74_03165 [Candidatus Daviesbacteria bacterium]|nr:hypothetical protein [Candidatus Daviesbacteria bacterium]
MKIYSNITRIFIIWAVAVLIVSFYGFSTLPHSNKFEYDFWKSLANWDGGHFLGIARTGYSQNFQYAFFPLYPLTIKALTYITGNFVLSAILISIVSSFLGLNILYKLVVLDFDKKLAEKVIITLLFFPTSFFLLTAYSEGLFFLLSISAFYFLRQNKLFWAIVAAALASATRLVGLAVVAGLFIEIWSSRGINCKNWYLIFAPLGFVIYCVFLYLQTGDPFYFLTAENHWQRTLSTPVVGFWEALKNIAGGNLTQINIFFDLISAIFGVGFAIRAFRFLPSSFAIYSLLSVGIPLFTPTLSSMPRFLLPIFPIFILMALIKNQYIQLLYQMLGVSLLAIFVSFFISGYWVS